MNVADDATTLAALARALHDEFDESDAAEAIVRQAPAVLPEAVHSSVMLVGRRQNLRVSGASSTVAERAGRLQSQLGEGPAHDLSGDDGWLRSGDVTADDRWPRWGPAVGRLGLRSQISMQLHSGDRVLGVISMGATDYGCFVDPLDVDRALLWAVHAAHALAAAHTITGLETAVSSRHRIGMAQGIVMERFGLSQQQAFTLLCRLSSYRNEKLRDIAESIVATRAIPTSTQSS